MEELLSILNSIYPLTDELRDHFKNIIQWKQIAAGEHLLKPGHCCRHVYYIHRGLVRCYYVKDDLTEVNNWFMTKGDVVFAVRSFLDQVPSDEAMQVLKETEVYYISYKDLQDIYKNHTIFNIHGRVLTEKYYKLSEDRSFIMRMGNSQKRYDYLVKHYFDLVNSIPDRLLASYIGVTPVTLSRIRGRKKKV